MSLASEAKEEAVRFVEDIARGLIRDAIQYRRDHPCMLAKFHQIMQHKIRDTRRPNGKHLRLWKSRIATHRFWEMFYSSRCEAMDVELAKKCGICAEP